MKKKINMWQVTMSVFTCLGAALIIFAVCCANIFPANIIGFLALIGGLIFGSCGTNLFIDKFNLY